MPRPPLVALLAVLVSILAVAPTASAQQRPTYRSPTFKGKAPVPKTAPAKPPTPVPLAADGLHPDVYVDEGGTAHAVWTIDRGDEADAAVYCRLKRGASTCDAGATLVPAKTYGTGDGPQFDIDLSGPEILRVGDQLVILSYRYPTVFDRPDGAGSGGVVQWVSDDGGATWSGGILTARYDINGGAIVIGGPESPRLLAISQLGAAPSCVQQIRAGAYDGTCAYVGNEGPDRNYNGSLALDAGTPVAAVSDLVNQTHVRRWNGVEPITDAANWTPALTVGGDEPILAGGAAGLFLLNRPEFSKPFAVRKLDPAGPGTPVQVSDPAHDAVFGRLAQDSTGRLLAAWENRGGQRPTGVYVRNAIGGGSFGTSKLLLPGEANGQMELAATDDGGGFLIANNTGGINSVGSIVAVPFGNQAPTGKPGVLGVPGGGDPSVTQTCQVVTFGAVRIGSREGCFLRGTGALSYMSVSEGEIDLSGLRLIPDAGVKIVIDPRAKRIYTTGAAKVVLSGAGIDITLWHGKIQLDTSAGVGSVLASFDLAKFPVNLLGFGLRGKLDVLLTGDGVRVPVSMQLPAYMGGIRGEAELIGKRGTGLVLESLKAHVGNLFLGPLLVEYFDLSYTRSGTLWSAKTRLKVPAGGALEGTAEFADGAFKFGSLALEPPPPGIVIGPAVYLTRIGGSFGLEPTRIGGEVRIGAGAAVNGVSPISVVGTIDAVFPRGAPFTVEAKGRLNVFALEIATAYLRFVSDGYVEFGGAIDLSLPAISLKGGSKGFVDGVSGQWGLEANVDLCIDLEIGPFSFPCVGGGLALSPIGMAVCGYANLPEPVGRVSGGLELPWNDISGAELLNPFAAAGTFFSHLTTPCNTGDYVVPPRPRVARAAQAAGAVAVTVPAGKPTVTVALAGEGGAPDVDVTGPNGVALPPGSYVARSKGVSGTYVVLAKPAGGPWTFTPKAGSPAIVNVLQSEGYTPANVTGKVKRGSVAYSVASGAGQTVQFAERGAFGTRIIGSARAARGTLRFTPATGKGGKREVIALVQHEGVTITRKVLGSFTAPSPSRPARPSRVRVRRAGSSATVTWNAARGAARYVVTVQGSHGLRRQFVVRARRVRLSRLSPGDRITAKVVAVAANGRRST